MDATCTTHRWLFAVVLTALAGPADANGRMALSPAFECVIEPSRTIEVSSPVVGVLESVDVDRGRRVERGEVLARLRSEVEQATVALARARADSAVRVDARKVQAELKRRSLARINELYDRRMVSSLERDEAQTATTAARYDVKEAEEDRRLARLELTRAEEVLALRTVRSPIAGVVVERFRSTGEYVEEQPILKLAQLDPLHVEIVATMDAYGSITEGMRGIVRPEAPVGGQHEAVVTIVDTAIDASSATFRIRLELPNPGHQIPAGVTCGVAFAEPLAQAR